LISELDRVLSPGNDVILICSESVYYVGRLKPDGVIVTRERKLMVVPDRLPIAARDDRYRDTRYMGFCRLIDDTQGRVLGELAWQDRTGCPYESALTELFKVLHGLTRQAGPMVRTGVYATLGMTGAVTSSVYDEDP